MTNTTAAKSNSQPEVATAPLLEALTTFNKAAGDELRLQILRVLRHDSYGVVELSTVFDIGQSGMSHHLKVLATAGLVARRREGNSIFYSRSHQAADNNMAALHQELLTLSDQLVLPADIESRVAGIREQRASHSRQFFEQHAGSFTRQQEQISEFSVYAQPVLELLQSLDKSQRDSALEIGPGTGQLLPELSELFGQLIALDNSAEMLEASSEHCRQNGVNEVRFIHGDISTALSQGVRVQNVIVAMVLHHLASPADLIRDVSELLEDGGQLFIAELCEHDQDWVRESCGDLWLGIDPGSLSDWARQHRLQEVGTGQYLGLRNGFTVQIRQFCKTPSIH